MVQKGEDEENKENFESGEEDEQSRRGAKEQAGRTKSLDIDKDGVDGGVRGLNRPQLLQQGSLRTSQSDNALPSRAIYSVGALGTGRALSGWGRGFLSVCLEHVDDPVTGRPRLMTVVAMDALIQEEPFKVTRLKADRNGMELSTSSKMNFHILQATGIKVKHYNNISHFSHSQHQTNRKH